MEAASRGARAAGGRTLGILPGTDPREANPHVEVPVATGLGAARNALVVMNGDAVVAIGGAWGTVSELALARVYGKPVLSLRGPALDGVPRAASVGEVAAWLDPQAGSDAKTR